MYSIRSPHNFLPNEIIMCIIRGTLSFSARPPCTCLIFYNVRAVHQFLSASINNCAKNKLAVSSKSVFENNMYKFLLAYFK